jgi:predicted RNase H-like HicB family nuclease
MRQLKIVLEKTKDGYSAYAENAEGVYGAGKTADEAKQSIIEAIRLLKKYNKPANVPAILRADYKLVYRFDSESLLNYYKGIFSNAALERITGINQRQIQHYAAGLKKPREAQLKKIENALHKLGSELMAVEL